jgi:alkylresorcinol/alkylpyrone synthase
MRESRILGVRTAFPPHRYPQAELTAQVAELSGVGADQRGLLESLHRHAGVQFRHIVMPIGDYDRLRGIDATGACYLDKAAELGEQALRGALEAAGVTAADLDLLIVTSVTGVTVPSLDARLIERMGLRRDIKRLPVFGLGCVAGAAALSRMHDYLLAWPDHHAAVLAVELCSLSWPMSDVTTADLVSSGLFGDGAAAVVATGGDSGVRVVATYSEVYPDSIESLGWRLGADGFRIVLQADLAATVQQHLAGTVTAFLTRHGLTVDDITTWICHPGGPKVIDAVQNSLKLPDSAVESSRRSLAQVGNLSSASVLHILESTLATPPPPDSVGLMVGLGPGVSVELVLLRW